MRDHMIGDGALFQPDALMPSQYFATVRKRVPKEPEYRLVVAVLEDAVDCILKHQRASNEKARRLFLDAEAWIASDDRDWPFSFVNICELLSIDPEYVRRGLTARKPASEGAATRGRLLARTLGPTDPRNLTAKAS